MILGLMFVGGVLLGWLRARARGGKTGDKVQYALVHGIAGVLLGLIGLVIAARLGLI